MKKIILAICLFAASCLPVFGDRVLVKFNNAETNASIVSEAKKYGGEHIEKIHQIGVDVFSVPGESKDALLKAFKSNPNVEFVEEDAGGYGFPIVPNDPSYGSQWHLANIHAADAWSITMGDPSIIIGFIDSGADYNHPDLAPNLIRGPSFTTDSSTSDDDYGHGTATAGTASAVTNNLLGVASVAPNCKIIMVRGLDNNNYGYYSWWAQGITYLADNGARIINMSMGGVSTSSTMQSAVNYARGKGIIIIASAGNSGDTTPHYPAALVGVIAVSATDFSDNLASWSTRGTFIDLSAPGAAILTTHIGGSYASWSGTSFSAPIVAGVAALIISKNPSLTVEEVEAILFSSSDDFGTSGWDSVYGWGRINAYEAVLMANEPLPEDTVSPSAPSGLIASNIQSSSFTLKWSASNDNVGVTGYEVFKDGVSIGTTSGLLLGVTNLMPSTSYSMTVRARDSAGNWSAQSLPLTVTTITGPSPDTIAPSAPTNLVASGINQRGFTLAWNASVDNVEVVGYEIFADGILVGAVTTTSFKVIGLTGGQTYSMTVSANDAAGNRSEQSAALSVFVPKKGRK